MTDKPLNPFQRIADRAADRSTGSPGIVVWIALGLAVVGGWLGALHLPLDADTNALIGRDRWRCMLLARMLRSPTLVDAGLRIARRWPDGAAHVARAIGRASNCHRLPEGQPS